MQNEVQSIFKILVDISVKICNFNLEIWKFGNLEIWKFGNLEIWKFGNLEIWKFGFN
jgi:hypothetical protein